MQKLIGIFVIVFSLILSSAIVCAEEEKDENKNKDVVSHDKNSKVGKNELYKHGKKWVIYW